MIIQTFVEPRKLLLGERTAVTESPPELSGDAGCPHTLILASKVAPIAAIAFTTTELRQLRDLLSERLRRIANAQA